jgi:hypothetical protein
MPTTPADRFVFSKLARLLDWRSALVIVKPATLIGWHRAAFRLFWRQTIPAGSPVHYAIVRYGTDPKRLSQTAKSPIRSNPDHSEFALEFSFSF